MHPLTAGSRQPHHPGEILLTEFLEPLELSQTRPAHAMEVPPQRVNGIVLGKRAVTADAAVRLSRVFGTSALFWLNLLASYDLEFLAGLPRY